MTFRLNRFPRPKTISAAGSSVSVRRREEGPRGARWTKHADPDEVFVVRSGHPFFRQYAVPREAIQETASKIR